MSGDYNWPEDPFDGPYGYYGIIIQKGAIRFGCNGPAVPIKSYKEIYEILGEAQKKLIAKQPKTLEEAFEATTLKTPSL